MRKSWIFSPKINPGVNSFTWLAHINYILTNLYLSNGVGDTPGEGRHTWGLGRQWMLPTRHQWLVQRWTRKCVCYLWKDWSHWKEVLKAGGMEEKPIEVASTLTGAVWTSDKAKRERVTCTTNVLKKSFHRPRADGGNTSAIYRPDILTLYHGEYSIPIWQHLTTRILQ